MARDAGLVVRPDTTRDALIAYITGEAEPPTIPNDLDSWRHGIIGFLLDHWRQVETQLTCPAKNLKKGGSACFGCIDTQVVSCLVTNERDLYQIRIHRK